MGEIQAEAAAEVGVGGQGSGVRVQEGGKEGGSDGGTESGRVGEWESGREGESGAG
jgi:hypothetical protein